jgi:hypothetical protein
MSVYRRTRTVHRIHCVQSDRWRGDSGYGRCPQSPLGCGGTGKTRRRARDHYYHSERIPLFLLTVYAKAQKTDLSPTEKATMRRLVAEIVASYFPKRS